MKNWIVNNFWIKIVSLILAIITWFYVNGELDKERRIPGKFYKTLSPQEIEAPPAAEKKQMNKGYVIKRK